MQRILNCRSSDFEQPVTGLQLRDAIAACEGRVIMAEVAAEAPALFAEVSNAELLCAFGADLLLLKGLHCQQPVVTGGHSRFGHDAITQMKKLTGRLIGVSLEVLAALAPVGANVFSESNLAAVEHADFFCLTGYDKPGVTVERICEAIAVTAQQTDKMIVVAKFCSVGLALPQEYAAFIAAGAHGVIFPAPAGCRGASEEKAGAIVDAIQQHKGLAITTLSSSQEGADCATVREIGLASKRCGSDMHNFGDAGVAGMASPEAVNALSMAIRGRRHTWVRMAASLSR
jgi:hypothetical protein